MNLIAEYVSPGHPDRLCDAIVENCVSLAAARDCQASIGLECTVNLGHVYLDGRIAGGRGKPVVTHDELDETVRRTYANAGYNALWRPDPQDLHTYLDVCIEKLSDDERDIRQYSDDQNVVCGYACNSPETNYLPVAHFIANRIGVNLWKWRNENASGFLGPDFKILVHLVNQHGQIRWERLTLSWQHTPEADYQKLFFLLKKRVDAILAEYSAGNLQSLSKLDEKRLYLNGAGDFIQGGPEGDNGLSGKKLVVDFYGPDVPIGGGAICGKDSHKVDVCGAFRARELALRLVKERGCESVQTRLAWSPGESEPYLYEAFEVGSFGTRRKIDTNALPSRNWFSIECINNDMNLAAFDRSAVMLNGYMNW
ncbi:MAG TPA: methionine adenosyltransferase domain-containing protein [Clostridiales bacterium]|nr:methionine adenosyltransferase domain-containing protein [Clostridiales bacterium]